MQEHIKLQQSNGEDSYNLYHVTEGQERSDSGGSLKQAVHFEFLLKVEILIKDHTQLPGTWIEGTICDLSVNQRNMKLNLLSLSIYSKWHVY